MKYDVKNVTIRLLKTQAKSISKINQLIEFIIII